MRARRRPRGEVVSLAEEFAGLLSPLLVPDERVLRRGLDLFARHQRLGGFDAVLAACAIAIANGAAALVSADRGFRPIDGLNHVVPDEEGVSSLERPWSGSGSQASPELGNLQT